VVEGGAADATNAGYAQNEPLLARRLRWAGRGAWAIADQGLFAVSNFAMNILLARWLTPTEYGAFAVAYSVFLLYGTFYTALLIEPMLIFGSAKYEGNFVSYMWVLLRGHWLVSGIGGVLLALAGGVVWLAGSRDVGVALVALAPVAPCVLLTWLTRRACFAQLQPHLAALAGMVYMVLMLGGLAFLFQHAALSVPTALAVMGVSSLVAGIWLIRRITVQGRPNDKSGEATMRGVRDDHWGYGRWALATSVISWLPSNLLLVAMGTFTGLAGSAAFKAMLNLVMPLLQSLSALAILLLPTLVRVRGRPAFRKLSLFALALFVGGAVAYWLALGAFAEPLVHLLYKGRYHDTAELLWVIGLLPISAAVVAVLSTMLRAIERPDQIFWAYVVSAVVTATVGIAALAYWGLLGAAVGQLAASLATAISLTVIFWLRGRHAAASSVPAPDSPAP
jgi:O-antigen/teichoic acid export membrane protein